MSSYQFQFQQRQRQQQQVRDSESYHHWRGEEISTLQASFNSVCFSAPATCTWCIKMTIRWKRKNVDKFHINGNRNINWNFITNILVIIFFINRYMKKLRHIFNFHKLLLKNIFQLTLQIIALHFLPG